MFRNATHGDDKMDSELLDTSAYLLALCSTLHQVVARGTSTRSCAQRVETVVKRDLDCARRYSMASSIRALVQGPYSNSFLSQPKRLARRLCA